MAKRTRRSSASSKLPALWTCPKCDHRFVTRNIWHSCAKHTLDEHFEGRDPKLRRAFDAFVAAVKRVGPITVEPQKTRIVLVARVRFAGCVVRKNWIEVGLALSKRSDDPRFYRVERYGAHFVGHHFKLASPSDVDAGLRALLPDAYSVGTQERQREKRAAQEQ